MLENLHRTKEMGIRSRDLLLSGDLFTYAELMHEHWLNKRQRSPGMASARIDELYMLARRSGVVGGKLVGAGGGGFLLVYARNPADTRQAMAAAGALSCRSTSSSAERTRASTMKAAHPLRVAIVGCGLIGHKRARRSGPPTRSSARSTSIAERADALVARARRHGLPELDAAACARARRRRRRD